MHGMVFRSFDYNGVFALIAFVFFFLMLPGRYTYSMGVQTVLFGSLGGICLLLAVLVRRKVSIDQDRHEVREVFGVWPILFVRCYPFSAIRVVEAAVRRISSRYGYRYVFPIRLLTPAGPLEVKQYSIAMDAFDAGQNIAVVIGVPFQNEVGMVYY